MEALVSGHESKANLLMCRRPESVLVFVCVRGMEASVVEGEALRKNSSFEAEPLQKVLVSVGGVEVLYTAKNTCNI
ncbi:hypothetical protein E2C01_043475 [Portunus trituberculatus]|uniref:Uncharacterized protein n=1 Tax=Portunus trituberculatus TaxID=210409 RepID=A0A5B7FWH5_PORTR|nr:hypothetical protein [Portunus trituberculatus]